jgi:beta-1,4-mannosyl-glycoprotein beta-1,4-N-acetylglucosaminyltransferase
MRLIDCFIFYNELDILKYRLDTLYDIFDHFVLVESRYTHNGCTKSLYYNENKEMFEKYKDKIIHIIEDTAPFIYPNINIKENQQWVNEQYHRNCIQKGLQKIHIHDDDIFTIMDLDEIPDPETIKRVRTQEIQVSINCLEQDLYYYNLNSKLLFKWYHPKIICWKDFREQELSFSQIRMGVYSIIFNGGWHLSYFGDKYFIQNKLTYFAHQEFNRPEYNDLNKIQKNIDDSVDLFNRPDIPIKKISIHHNSYLPPDCETKLKKYILF